MKNRGKFANARQINTATTATTTNNNNNNNNNKSQNDDDNCSVVCYKDFDDGHVGVVRIRQQPVCSACNVMRGTLSLYYKHVLENNHRENVKKSCDENRFVPSVYDQAIHLAFHNNFYYQSDKFYFRYKHTNEEPVSSSQHSQSTETAKTEPEKLEINNNQQKSSVANPRKRRNLQVTLVFQDKTYSQIGTTTNQIREQLLKEMIADRANDIAALPMEIYYIKKKIAPDNIHHNAQKSSVIFTMVKDQSQVLLKKQQQQQEPFENGDMSSANNSIEDNDVEQNTAMTTHEISNTEKIDIDEPPSLVDDIINVCKDVLNTINLDIYSKCGELKREQQFLSGIARRSFKKKNTFFCDICSIFLTSEKYCTQHLNGLDHLENFRHYQTTFLPWRLAMQTALINGKSMKEIMGNDAYENYKRTMASYLVPTSLSNRGRFCCAYCEVVLTDQWALEKHLHTVEHKEKQTSSDHKDLVIRFANVVIIPAIFKFNGVTQLSEIPDDIKNRYQWRCVTREQLDEDTITFIRCYPYDGFEGATRIINIKQARKAKSLTTKSVIQNLRINNANNKSNAAARIQHKKHGGFNNTRRGQFSTPLSQRGTPIKRSFPATGPPNKRFRGDLNNSFPGANRDQVPMRNYETEQYNYAQSAPYNNGNNRWPGRHPVDQQREKFFERSNFELQSLASDNTGYYSGSRPSQLMSRGNNYEHEQQQRFNGGGGGGRYDSRPSNYDPGFIRAVAKAVAEYHPEPNSAPGFASSSNRPYQRSNQGPTNEFIHQVANTIQRSQHHQSPAPIMSQTPYPNSNSLSGFGVNNSNNTKATYFPNSSAQQQTQMGNSGPPVRSYADYRASTGPSIANVSPSMYPPSLANTQNPVVSQSHAFNDFNHSSLAHNNSSNTYGRPSFGNEEPRYGNFGHQNQMQQSSQAPWRGSSRGGSNVRGGRGQATDQFQAKNKQPGSTFSFSSSNNNHNNNSSMRGRGAIGNARNFGSRR
ncbi:unnamed protein product [Rotaria magnacalcarata]|uniref:Matrin-type domain-containing protein n=2 Tax=Rotaria magnacalcarata TaxID=392030 RepID=A0A815WEF6_9BILA|nr:unnamed protein product [Rotaria magnacalcarata]